MCLYNFPLIINSNLESCSYGFIIAVENQVLAPPPVLIVVVIDQFMFGLTVPPILCSFSCEISATLQINC